MLSSADARSLLLLCRPFGSRVAETLLKRSEVLIADALDEQSSAPLQQVAMLADSATYFSSYRVQVPHPW